jgi:hypothetical protein
MTVCNVSGRMRLPPARVEMQWMVAQHTVTHKKIHEGKVILKDALRPTHPLQVLFINLLGYFYAHEMSDVQAAMPLTTRYANHVRDSPQHTPRATALVF